MSRRAEILKQILDKPLLNVADLGLAADNEIEPKKTPTMAQLRMFADEAPPPATPTADLDRVRRKLEALLVEARAAGVHGLPVARRRLMETVVPQMIRWLPEEEAERTKKVFGEVLPD